MTKRSFISAVKWLVTIVLLVGGVMVIRYFCMESYRVSTDSMEVALHKGDYMLVNKLPQKDNPGRNRVVLFTSPLLKDTTSSPLFLSRCIGMPGDTIRISNDGYRVNGRLIPHSPRSLNTYIVTQAAQEEVLAAQKKLNIPLREMKEESFGISFNLTSFEEYQIREELSEDANIRFLKNPMDTYELVVPQKGRAYRLNAAALTACREAIRAEAGDIPGRSGNRFLLLQSGLLLDAFRQCQRSGGFASPRIHPTQPYHWKRLALLVQQRPATNF